MPFYRDAIKDHLLLYYSVHRIVCKVHKLWWVTCTTESSCTAAANTDFLRVLIFLYLSRWDVKVSLVVARKLNCCWIKILSKSKKNWISNLMKNSTFQWVDWTSSQIGETKIDTKCLWFISHYLSGIEVVVFFWLVFTKMFFPKQVWRWRWRFWIEWQRNK